MKEFLTENQGVILFVFFLITFALLIWVLLYNHRISKNLVTKKFTFNDMKEIGVTEEKKIFSVTVANRTLNDISITAIGLVHRLQYFDFHEKYKTANAITEENKIVVAQRSSIKLEIDIAEAEKLIFSNMEKKRIGKVQAYVTDNSGNVSKGSLKKIKTLLKADYKIKKTLDDMMARQTFIREGEKKKAAGEQMNFADLCKLFCYKKRMKAEAQAVIAKYPNIGEEITLPELAAQNGTPEAFLPVNSTENAVEDVIETVPAPSGKDREESVK